MRTLKKLFAILLILSLAAAASACGGSWDKQIEGSQAGASGQVGSAPAAGAETALAPDSAPAAGAETSPDPDSDPAYRDGTYEITTDKDYEGYFVKASLTVRDGRIADFQYDIYDSKNGDAIFDEDYEDYMPSQHYKQQCRDDLKGMKTYGPKLVETQSVDDVDVVSKATWTWKWFREAAQELLEQAAVK